MGEVFEQLRAVRRVHHFRVELHGVDVARLIGDGGEGRAVGFSNDLEPVGDRIHAIAMAHPHLMARAWRPHPFKQTARLDYIDHGAAEFAMVRAFNVAAELGADRLFAVTDAEDRRAVVKDRLVGAGAGLDFNARRPAGEDDRPRGEFLEEGLVDPVEGMDFAINPVLAEAAGDKLGHLAAEIDNQGAVVLSGVGIRLHVEPLADSGRRVTPCFRECDSALSGVRPPRAIPDAGAPPAVSACAARRQRSRRCGFCPASDARLRRG